MISYIPYRRIKSIGNSKYFLSISRLIPFLCPIIDEWNVTGNIEQNV